MQLEPSINIMNKSKEREGCRDYLSIMAIYGRKSTQEGRKGGREEREKCCLLVNSFQWLL